MADNSNTEYTKCLHIDLAKDAYCLTNSKDEYPQVTSWLDRWEHILMHDKYLQWQLSTVVFDNPGDQPLPPPPPPLLKFPPLVFPHKLKMSQQPTSMGLALT